MSESPLIRLRAWYTRTAPTVERSGHTLEYEATSPSTPKPAAWVTLSSADRLGRLIVWVTGEAQLSLGDSRTGQVTDEHRELRSELDLTDVTDVLARWVLGTSDDGDRSSARPH